MRQILTSDDRFTHMFLTNQIQTDSYANLITSTRNAIAGVARFNAYRPNQSVLEVKQNNISNEITINTSINPASANANITHYNAPSDNQRQTYQNQYKQNSSYHSPSNLQHYKHRSQKFQSRNRSPSPYSNRSLSPARRRSPERDLPSQQQSDSPNLISPRQHQSARNYYDRNPDNYNHRYGSDRRFKSFSDNRPYERDKQYHQQREWEYRQPRSPASRDNSSSRYGKFDRHPQQYAHIADNQPSNSYSAEVPPSHIVHQYYYSQPSNQPPPSPSSTVPLPTWPSQGSLNNSNIPPIHPAFANLSHNHSQVGVPFIYNQR